VHVVYHLNSSQIFWFGELVEHNPGILYNFEDDDVINKEEMVIFLFFGYVEVILLL